MTHLTETEITEQTHVSSRFLCLLRKLTLLKPLPYRAYGARGRNVFVYPKTSVKLVRTWYRELQEVSPPVLEKRARCWMSLGLRVDPSGFVSRNRLLLCYLKTGEDGYAVAREVVDSI